MPNWCRNEVTVHSEDQEVLDKIKLIFASGRPFNTIRPRPLLLDCSVSGGRTFEVDGEKVQVTAWYRDPETQEERPFTEEEKKELDSLGYGDWYEWSIANWGTKWDIDPQEPVDEDGCSVRFDFDTAWSPPDGIYKALVEMLGDQAQVSWFYREDGMQIAGWLDKG